MRSNFITTAQAFNVLLRTIWGVVPGSIRSLRLHRATCEPLHKRHHDAGSQPAMHRNYSIVTPANRQLAESRGVEPQPH
jgi:hypothetical protein